MRTSRAGSESPCRRPPGDTGPRRVRSGHHGFTLLEVVIVLVLLGMTAALVGPSLVPEGGEPDGSIAAVLNGAKRAAARRGESVYLTIAPSGHWRLDARASPAVRPLATGLLAMPPGPAVTLIVSPVGSCNFDARSLGAGSVMALDVLTCRPGPP